MTETHGVKVVYLGELGCTLYPLYLFSCRHILTFLGLPDLAAMTEVCQAWARFLARELPPAATCRAKMAGPTAPPAHLPAALPGGKQKQQGDLVTEE